MDTSTHIVTGIGIAGLAHLDPSVSQLSLGLLTCTILGSNAPDFDFLMKYKSKEAYVKEHRGTSHSIPMVLCWALFISSIVAFISSVPFYSLFIWTLLAVVSHVIFDIFNIYGTQALRPFSDKWIALHLLPIFDPYIMGAHLLGICFWMYGFHPGVTFLIVYLIIALYILVRYVKYATIISQLKKNTNEDISFTLLPTVNMNKWSVIANKQEQYSLGKYVYGSVTWSKVLPKPSEKNKVIKASMKSRFISFIKKRSQYVHAKIVKKVDGYEVHWFDIRYQSKIDEPFIAVIHLDKQLNLIKSNLRHGLISAPVKT
ncbi:metal-dependent hydrolase [Evansella cellulosilytica]|uniref:Membrane-bound metal-dependent hydrolase n=1 Tax=Evansella cellulosilytica (strain ATCC 21833 / DSM 2522 / FERM P-1141 / JCM 9156 / N-4) TaxID=649639 RepID=E6U001_EVAC2|nr:metal-dependent hydrolase [Evansella cellulosilytica]ADU29005.1 membrane-bound metal-dependent hydrolase [Evansella cellulosilytica DSM 2522]